MKPMLDKDFDAFFKSSFEDFEVAPAADSWNKISDKLKVKRTKQSFPFFWKAAASVIIVLGIGIGLYTKPIEVIKLHPDGENEMMTNLAQEQKNPVDAIQKDVMLVEGKTGAKAKKALITKELSQMEVSDETISQAIIETKDEPIDTELRLAKITKPVRTKLATERLIEQEDIAKIKKIDPTTLVQTAYEMQDNAIRTNQILSKAPKISTVGDLVNFVIAKVDKREEKLIKMSRTEESNNEITGINLGLFKFRKLD